MFTEFIKTVLIFWFTAFATMAIALWLALCFILKIVVQVITRAWPIALLILLLWAFGIIG